MKLLLLLPLLCLTACASDFITDPTRPRPTRAVQTPIERNDATGETLGGGATAVPLLTVDIPNNKDENPQFHTLSDALRTTPVTPPASRPAPPRPRPVDPILGQ